MIMNIIWIIALHYLLENLRGTGSWEDPITKSYWTKFNKSINNPRFLTDYKHNPSPKNDLHILNYSYFKEPPGVKLCYCRSLLRTRNLPLSVLRTKLASCDLTHENVETCLKLIHPFTMRWHLVRPSRVIWISQFTSHEFLEI